MSGHVPVLLAEVLDLLDPAPGERVLDATVGCGGHARALADRVGPGGVLVGVDRDDAAMFCAREALADSQAEVHLVRANFADLERALDGAGQDRVEVALLDLGMSSSQLEDAARGFSFRAEGPLDMRMDRRESRTAEDIVNGSDERELADLFGRLGEEHEARRVARALVQARLKERIRTTVQLAALIARAKRRRRGRIHPATKVFQALRMAVNREVESLTEGLRAAWRRLAPGGRMAAISFHSIEDRIVKRFFRGRKQAGLAELLTKKPVRPSRPECAANPRARSARLRVLRRVRPDVDAGTNGAAS